MSPADIAQVFALPFMGRALLVAAVISVAAAMIGLFVNLRNLEFVSDGLTHSVFPGLVIGYIVGGTEWMVVGALAAAMIGAVTLTVLDRRHVGSDAAVAVVLTSMFSIGVVLVSRRSGYVSELEQLLFGNLLAIPPQLVGQIVAVSAAACLIIVIGWKWFLFRAFDARGFAAAGFPTLPYDVALNSAVALIVVAGSQAIGNLMVLALIIVPVGAARLVTRRVLLITPIAAALAVTANAVGLVVGFDLSVNQDVSASPSAVAVLTLIAFYLVIMAMGLLARAFASHGKSPTSSPSPPPSAPDHDAVDRAAARGAALSGAGASGAGEAGVASADGAMSDAGVPGAGAAGVASADGAMSDAGVPGGAAGAGAPARGGAEGGAAATATAFDGGREEGRG
ncbi:metal ABC transporter permease [Rarobacter incanus]|uniref:Manganese/iron transport system permease protein n=1 Tax=Rarobacter incanus TaxID=153494 RepID=A0A542SQI6_9MICO|nr:metal ABC transporter permease [Rarobacter incanus]TQK76881.1 manganese/iron transport system permease protein [Rarobacter incanus]